MKKYQVQILPQARQGIRQLMAYIRRRESDARARSVRKAILEKIRSLDSLPESHEKLHEICDEQTVYRRVFQWDFRIIFQIVDDELRVLVVDVDYGPDDPQKLLERFGK